MRSGRLVAVAAIAAAALAASGAPASAAVEDPGWELSANSYPTNFGSGVDEVQEIEATEEGGTFTLSYEGVETAALPDHASSAEIESALEGLVTVGAGNVEVAGSAGKYTAKFVNLLGNTSKVAALEATGANISIAAEGASSGTIGIDVFNIGAGTSNGTITVTDTLPSGIKAKEAGELIAPSLFGEENFGLDPIIEHSQWDCTGNGSGPSPSVAGATVVTCTNDPVGLPQFEGGAGTPTFGGENFHPQPAVGIAVEVEHGAPEGEKVGAIGNHVSISGGGALEGAATVSPVTINAAPAPGGLTQADAWTSKADGTVDRQAGSHPYSETFLFDAATALNSKKEGYIPGSEIRNLDTELPPGFIGDLHSIPQCTRPQLFASACPPESMVGRLEARTFGIAVVEQVFNMVPSPGVPAELGFIYGVPVYVGFSVKTGGDNGIVAHVANIPQRLAYQSILTIWGVPGETSHDIWRRGQTGCGPGNGEGEVGGPPFNGKAINYCRPVAGRKIVPFLRLPTSCGAPQTFAFREVNGWQDSGARSEVAFVSHDALDNPAGFTGCEQLVSNPSFTASLDTALADSPSGLLGEVRPPLISLEEPNDLAPADIQNTTVTLPEGLVINPGQASGLQACPPGRPGPGNYGDALTTPDEASRGVEDFEAASCPPASKVGTVVIKSPLIEADAEKQFEGNVYVLASNPPEVKLLVAASADGVNVKLVGIVHLDERTGRIVTTFAKTPQLPFSDLKLDFEGGVKAALATPTQCGTSAADATFTPWSAPPAVDWLETSAMALTAGPGGSPCPPTTLGFVPTLATGPLNSQAGAFTSFTTQLGRGDGQQRIERLMFKAPPGITAAISSVPLCPEPLAQEGKCAASSQIGHASVTSGPGADPLALPQPGKPAPAVYLTGPYAGAPFGLSIVTPVLAGPFDLGTIVTRARIEIDSRTAQVTITTDPLPQIVKGVPTDLRSVEAVIDRPNFMLNPTSCNESSFSGVATGAGPPGSAEPGVPAPITTRSQVGSCRSLIFTPQVSLATGAHASKANGQSLSVRIAYPKGAVGTQAWFQETKLDIPKQLPARLQTLQQACPDATFEARRNACPPHSVIGSAIVRTPLLPVPLQGPVYFVSHGGAKFPDVVMVLSGDNVTIVLTGETLIKNGVTSATFRNLPDVPFDSFEVTLPAGAYSEFAGNASEKKPYNFCGQKLVVPTYLRAQNGLEVHRSVPVSINGCSRKVAISSMAVKGRSLKLSIYVPGGGKVTATGKGLGKATKVVRGQEIANLVLHIRRTDRFSTRIALRYKPTKGKEQRVTKHVRA
jgi:hypothetical protein